MERFNCSGLVISEPTGDLVKFADVRNLCEELVGFVSQLIDEIQFNELTKEESIDALKVMLKLSIS